MSKYEVVIKPVEAMKVASIRDIVPTPPEQGKLWEELGATLAQQRVRTSEAPCLTLYYDDEYKEKDWDVEVCIPVQGALPETGRVKAHSLPRVEAMACTIHHGAFVTINEAYQALGRWIEQNGYRICGPAREVYLREAAPAGDGVSQVDQDTVTEVQFPVMKS